MFRMFICHRILLSLFVAFGLLALPAGAIADTSRYAAFVVDQDTGVVLHSRRSQAQRHPASLTKMMTLYLLFQAIEEGEIGLEDQIRISVNATRASPSRLDLEAGSTISVENAIRALVIKSANDVAVAVGERLSGGESRFAQHMTTRAEELGLTSTVFRNASGLPNSRQVTTAQDMARLAVAMERDFPQFFHYFNETTFRWNGRTYRNHNTLVGRVDGVTGLKTGYIRASGFNVVVTAQRGDHHLVAVVMGGPTAATRDAHAEELLEAAFASLEQREDSRLFAALSSPRINPIRQQDMIARDVAALDLDEPVEMGSAQSAPPLRVVVDDQSAPIQSAQVSSPLPRNDAAPVSNEVWAIQVGAYYNADAAHDRLSQVASLSASLGQAQPIARSVEINGRNMWRARFESLSAREARQACADFDARSEPCFTVAPRS
jgi:D-alanyl-D-alanine carboxypeptidase